MTKEEYYQKKKALYAKYESDKTELVREYVYTNNPYSTGSIISDSLGKIRVTRIFISKSFLEDLPICVYEGIELKKDGTPTKKERTRHIYQSNIINQ